MGIFYCLSLDFPKAETDKDFGTDNTFGNLSQEAQVRK